MAFKDKTDVWSEEEDNLTGFGVVGWTLVALFIVPWLAGLGLLVAWLFDL